MKLHSRLPNATLCACVQDTDVHTLLKADYIAAESAYLAALKKSYLGEPPAKLNANDQVWRMCCSRVLTASATISRGHAIHMLPAALQHTYTNNTPGDTPCMPAS